MAGWSTPHPTPVCSATSAKPTTLRPRWGWWGSPKHNINANAIAPVAKTRMTEDILGGLAEQLNPKLVTPVVIWLAHESNTTTGGVYSTAGGTVARFFIGLTQGTHRGADITAETVRDDWEQINDETGYMVPANPADEFGKLLNQWQEAQG